MWLLKKKTNPIVCIKRKFTDNEHLKVNKKGKIIFFCMIFVALATFAQNTSVVKSKLLLLELAQNPLPTEVSLVHANIAEANQAPFLSPGFYASQLGFFCKQEIKLEKFIKIPFRFRLGSVEECDRLEGKGKRKQ
jgi:hypothetical protein